MNGIIARGVVSTNQDIDLLDGVLFLGLVLGQFKEKEVARIEDEKVFPLGSQPLDESGLLGDPAKGIFVSATWFDLPLDVIGVNNGEVMLWRLLLCEGDSSRNEKKKGDENR